MKKALKLLCLLLVCSVLAVAVSVSALSDEEYEPEAPITEEAEVPAIEAEPEPADDVTVPEPEIVTYDPEAEVAAAVASIFKNMTISEEECSALLSSTLPIQTERRTDNRGSCPKK